METLRDRVPVSESIAVLVEEEAGFAKEPFVEAIVFLELGFAKADDARLIALGGQENPIDLEFGFFDGDGGKVIGGGVGGGIGE